MANVLTEEKGKDRGEGHVTTEAKTSYVCEAGKAGMVRGVKTGPATFITQGSQLGLLQGVV